MKNEPSQAQNPSIAVNLSDLYLYYSYDQENYPAWLKGTGSDRFYIGSCFCEKYFLKSVGRSQNEICRYAAEQRCGISVVVPVPSDRWSAPVRESLAGLIRLQPSVDEVVVNDYAMLSFAEELRAVSERPFRITAGRLFFKNYRDPRYEEQQQSRTVCFFPPMLRGKVDAAELDLCSADMDVSSVPEEIELHIHYPFTYVTCTKYCEFASGAAPDTEKFRTDMRCGLKCMDAVVQSDADGAGLLHLGKGVYAGNPTIQNLSRTADRFIYWPLNEFLEMEGKMQ